MDLSVNGVSKYESDNDKKRKRIYQTSLAQIQSTPLFEIQIDYADTKCLPFLRNAIILKDPLTDVS